MSAERLREFWSSVDLTGNQTITREWWLTNRYNKIADVDAEKQIAESMKYLSSKGQFNFSDAMLIKNGTATLYKK